jgi:hypothetical protein
VARLRMNDVSGAARVYTSLATINGGWTMSDALLEAYIQAHLSRGAASDAPGPPRH